MVPTNAKPLLLMAAALLLCGAEECDEASPCAQTPQGDLSAWSECELYTQDQTVMIHLTNEAEVEVAYLQGCDGPLYLEVLGEDGAFTYLPPELHCASEWAEWAPLPPPGDVAAPAWPLTFEEGTALPPGTYRGVYTVGYGCAVGVTEAPASDACEATETLATQPFTVLPAE